MKVNIDFSRVEVKKFDLPTNSLKLAFSYRAGEDNKIFEKTYNLGENTISFVMELIRDIKEKIKTENVASGLIILNFKGSEEDCRDKLFDAFRKILDKIDKLKKTKDSKEYMNLWNNVNNSVVGIR